MDSLLSQTDANQVIQLEALHNDLRSLIQTISNFCPSKDNKIKSLEANLRLLKKQFSQLKDQPESMMQPADFIVRKVVKKSGSGKSSKMSLTNRMNLDKILQKKSQSNQKDETWSRLDELALYESAGMRDASEGRNASSSALSSINPAVTYSTLKSSAGQQSHRPNQKSMANNFLGNSVSQTSFQKLDKFSMTQ